MSESSSPRSIKSLLLRWLVPPGFKDLTKSAIQSVKGDGRHLSRLAAGNTKYKNRHAGERCFIVCSGPSVKKQNLLPLKNEVTFFVSTGFLHPDYSTIQPAYHCTPGAEQQSPRFADWFRRMDMAIGNTQLFLSAVDEIFIRENSLFRERPVNYLHLGLEWDVTHRQIYDLSRKIPGVQTVPMMAIMIALYMGFKEIYLLGVDMDQLWSGEYKHFYDDEILRSEYVSPDGKVRTPRIEQFRIHHILWEQFTILKGIAEANGVQILNATAGGALDVYKRVDFEHLFPAQAESAARRVELSDAHR